MVGERKAIVAMVNIDGSDGWGFVVLLMAASLASQLPQVLHCPQAQRGTCGNWLASERRDAVFQPIQ